MKQHSLKLLCWNANGNCDVDVAINRTCHQSKKLFSLLIGKAFQNTEEWRFPFWDVSFH